MTYHTRSTAPQTAARPSMPPATGARPSAAALAAMGAAVHAMGEVFDISAEAMSAHEASDRLEVQTRLGWEHLARVASAPIAAWFDLFGADLSLELTLDGIDVASWGTAAVPAVRLRADDAPAEALAAFVARVRQLRAAGGIAEEGGILARLTLAKTRAHALADQVFAPDTSEGARLTSVNGIVFYGAGAWLRLLRLDALPLWEDIGLVGGESPCVVVLCDASGALAGTALTVWGARSDLDPDPDSVALLPTRAAWRRFRPRASEAYELRHAEGGITDDIGRVTPAHLWLRPVAPIATAPATDGAVADADTRDDADDALLATARALTRLRAEVAALYLASDATGDVTDGVRLRFAGARPATCTLVAAADGAREVAREPADDTCEAWLALGRLAEWAYGGSGASASERLIIARECLARELPAGQAVSLDALGHAAGPALVAARANLAILRRGQTEQYFQARQAAQDAVAGYGEAVRVAGAALASEVVDNVYRTVGLLVAVGIAALLQPNASLWLVRIAALLYTAYVFFVREFFVRSRAERHTLDRAAFERRVATMRELGASERATLAASADDSDAYFTRYLARARSIYLALIVAGAVLSVLLLTPLAGALSPGTHPAGHASPPPTATLQR